MKTMLKVKLTHTQKNSRDGSKENPYEPGDILFTVKVTGHEGAVDHDYSWKKLIGGEPEHPKIIFPEFRREGFNPTLGIPPLKTLSQFSYTARVWEITLGSEIEVAVSDTVKFWVMKGAPVPTWWIYCTDGRFEVDRDQLNYLRSGGWILPQSIPYDGKMHFDGTVHQLVEVFPDVDEPDEPDEPDTPDEDTPEPEQPDLVKQKIMESLAVIEGEVDRINGYLFELKT